MPGSMIGLTFATHAEGTLMPDVFVMAGLTFSLVDKRKEATKVVVKQGEHGLWFDSAAMKIRLPAASAEVAVRAGGFGMGMSVKAKNEAGAIVYERTLPPNAIENILLPGLNVLELEFTPDSDPILVGIAFRC